MNGFAVLAVVVRLLRPRPPRFARQRDARAARIEQRREDERSIGCKCEREPDGLAGAEEERARERAIGLLVPAHRTTRAKREKAAAFFETYGARRKHRHTDRRTKS